MLVSEALCQPLDVLPLGGGASFLRSSASIASDLVGSTDHQRNMRSVSARSTADEARLGLKANGVPVDPEVAASLTGPASGGTARLFSPFARATACVLVRIGMRVQFSAICCGKRASKSILCL